MKTQSKIDLIAEFFITKDNTFNLDEAIKLSGKFAGICYDKEGFAHLVNEPDEKTMRRVDMTINNGHHSVYDHIYIKFNLQNIPKALAMVLNNEKQYTTSEKSARYTPVIRNENSLISETEEKLYNKWLEIFISKIKDVYGEIYPDSKIKKLAQENARYLVSVFMPTQMIYTTSLRQINYIASWMLKYIKNINEQSTDFEKKLASSMQDFIEKLKAINVLEPALMKNEKNRQISLFKENLEQVELYFGDVYSTTYKGTLAQLAQAQRHRTLDYRMEFLTNKEYFIPPIIANDQVLVNEWLHDMNLVRNYTPQGELVRINERGTYENFILKCEERLCSAAQLEIMIQTRETLLKYKDALFEKDSHLAEDIQNYTHGARCTFPGFKCTENCHFTEGKKLTRRI